MTEINNVEQAEAVAVGWQGSQVSMLTNQKARLACERFVATRQTAANAACATESAAMLRRPPSTLQTKFTGWATTTTMVRPSVRATAGAR